MWILFAYLDFSFREITKKHCPWWRAIYHVLAVATGQKTPLVNEHLWWLSELLIKSLPLHRKQTSQSYLQKV
jgi:hypothetical protein